jgi:hypothetical protein
MSGDFATGSSSAHADGSNPPGGWIDLEPVREGSCPFRPVESRRCRFEHPRLHASSRRRVPSVGLASADAAASLRHGGNAPRPTNATISASPQILVERLLAEFVQFREPIVCVRLGKQGTAGVVVWDEVNEELALLTAGHVFPYRVGPN